MRIVHDDRASEAGADLLVGIVATVALGTVALVGVVPMPRMSLLWATAIELGAILLVLGATHAVFVGVLLVIKRRRRRQILEEEMP